MAAVQDLQEQRVILRNATWETYERLLDERGENRVPRFAYDRGMLEIMSPVSGEHEEYARNAEFVVRVLVGAFGLKVRTMGSMTLKRRDLQAGAEADACFYIRKVEAIRGKASPDLAVDPPPDMVIEVDVTNPSLDKLELYARLGVPELWRHTGNRMQIHLLEGDVYTQSSESSLFPGVTADALSTILRDIRFLDSDEWESRLRQWAGDLAAGREPRTS